MPLHTNWGKGATKTRKRKPRKGKRINKEYAAYLRTPHWKKLSAEMVEKAGGRCQKCGKEHKKLNVHHEHYYTLGRERPGDLTVLCPKCHLKAHGRGYY